MTQIVDWGATGSMLSAAATVFAVLVAILGARIALHQISASREAAALSAWNDYLRLCFENPNYACVDQARKVVPKGLSQLEDNPSVEAEKYQWFLSIVLNSCEQVLLGMPNVHEWRGTLVDQVWYHAEAIAQLWGKWKEGYSEKMQSIVDEGLSRDSGDA
jgi:hypothetical protein